MTLGFIWLKPVSVYALSFPPGVDGFGEFGEQ